MLERQYKAFRFGRHIDRRGPFAVSLPEVRIGRLGCIWPPRCGIRSSSEGCCPTLPFFGPLQWCPPPNLLIGNPLTCRNQRPNLASRAHCAPSASPAQPIHSMASPFVPQSLELGSPDCAGWLLRVWRSLSARALHVASFGHGRTFRSGV